MTTAEKLNAYRGQLLAGGMASDVVDDLVRDAARTLVANEGLNAGTAQEQHRISLAVGASNADWTAGYGQGYAAARAQRT